MYRFFLPALIAVIGVINFTATTQTLKSGNKTHNPDYFYTIGNGTDRAINFYASVDSLNWEQITLESNFQKKLLYPQETIFFKIYTSHSRFISYRIGGNTVYKIYYNPGIDLFDLLKY